MTAHISDYSPSNSLDCMVLMPLIVALHKVKYQDTHSLTWGKSSALHLEQGFSWRNIQVSSATHRTRTLCKSHPFPCGQVWHALTIRWEGRDLEEVTTDMSRCWSLQSRIWRSPPAMERRIHRCLSPAIMSVGGRGIGVLSLPPPSTIRHYLLTT